MASTVVIARRFRGPPESANGGYTCGLVAKALAADAAEVSLRRPPPLERPLKLEREGESARLADRAETVAEGRVLDDVGVELPPAPSAAAARRAQDRYPGFDAHNFPTCFVCGPERDPGDGLNVFPGPLGEGKPLACLWTPSREFADASGHVRTEIAWAALDCPSGIAAIHFADGENPFVLARLRARIAIPIDASAPHVVAGWAISSEGRKNLAGTAIFDAAGTAHAWAEALWIELRPDA